MTSQTGRSTTSLSVFYIRCDGDVEIGLFPQSLDATTALRPSGGGRSGSSRRIAVSRPWTGRGWFGLAGAAPSSIASSRGLAASPRCRRAPRRAACSQRLPPGRPSADVRRCGRANLRRRAERRSDRRDSRSRSRAGGRGRASPDSARAGTSPDRIGWSGWSPSAPSSRRTHR